MLESRDDNQIPARIPLIAFLLAALFHSAPPAAAQDHPTVHTGLGLGITAPGAPFEFSPSFGFRASLAASEHIAFGVMGSVSKHRIDGGGILELWHAAVEAEWMMDRGEFIPTLSFGAGALSLGATDFPMAQMVTHLTVGLDWWPQGAFRGVSLGAELRYLGTMDLAPSPILKTFALRVRWGW